MRALCGLALPLLLVACASTARITGDFGEYQSYRSARLATTVEARLGASERYLRAYPHGDYREEVRSWYVPAEQRYFRLSWNNLPRLRAYLDALPRGPHAAAAAERIEELESRTKFAERREQRAAERARGFEVALARAAEQRRVFLTELKRLTRLLAAVRSFKRPISELDPELRKAFGLRLLPGECLPDRCINVLSFAYAIPVDKELTTRSLDLTLELGISRGALQSLSLSAPGLLGHVAEAVLVRAIPADSPQAYAEALGSALELFIAATDAALPSDRCNAEAVSPIVLARRCEGVRLELVAGTEPGAPDRLQLLPEKR